MNIVAITAWREARSEGALGMAAVMHAIRNRAASNGHNGWPLDPEQVCLQAYQFSCWNSSDPQRNIYPRPGDAEYAQALALIANPPADPTDGCNSYYDVSIAQPIPAMGKTIVPIGRLRFYRV